MARKAPEVSLNEDEREALEGLTRRRKTAQALATRARIVLMCAKGMRNKEVAGQLGVDQATVGKWRRRFVERGVEWLHDAQRPGVLIVSHGVV
jgi:FixJ family two-component response regulator